MVLFLAGMWQCRGSAAGRTTGPAHRALQLPLGTLRAAARAVLSCMATQLGPATAPLATPTHCSALPWEASRAALNSSAGFKVTQYPANTTLAHVILLLQTALCELILGSFSAPAHRDSCVTCSSAPASAQRYHSRFPGQNTAWP